MEGIIEFHHEVMFLLVFIVFFVLYMIASIIVGFSSSTQSQTKPVDTFSHNTALEIA
jgi:heme/copper-type cytochrome/quinol oxidase subunit 2